MDTQDHAGPRPRASFAPAVLRQFLGLGFVVAVALPGLCVLVSGRFGGAVTLSALGLYGLAMALVARGLASRYPHDRLGLCNAVTIVRLGLTSVLFGALFAPAPAVWPLLALACLAFALDGLDGWLARRAQLASGFGARFDVEVDSAFALILAALAVVGGLSPLVLALGLPRYLFWGAQWVWPQLGAELAPRLRRKLVCVVQIAVLIVLLVPTLAPELRHALAALTMALVGWSFAVDIRALMRGGR